MPELHWWPRFCEAMGRPEWVVEPRFETVKSRFDHITELVHLIDKQFATKTLAEWGRIFDERGLIWGPAATVAELAADPQAEAAGLYPEIHHPDGTFRTVAAPFRIARADVRPRGPAPDVGQHTRQILEAAGLGPEEIEALGTQGVVGLPV